MPPTDYAQALLFAGLWHDIEKSDCDNRLNQNKQEHNQGCGGAAFLIRCGLRGQEAGLDLIRKHHLRKRGDSILRHADQISSRNRLEGGADNRFLKHFPKISARVKVDLTLLMNEFNANGGYNHERAREWIAGNRWLDIIPADAHCSTESQSLRMHLLETEDLTKILYKDPSNFERLFKTRLFYDPSFLKQTNRFETWRELGVL